MDNRRKFLVVFKLFDQSPKGVRCLIVRTLSLISGNLDFTFSVFFTSTGATAVDAAQLHFKSSSSTGATSGDATQLHFKSHSTNSATAGDAAQLHFKSHSTNSATAGDAAQLHFNASSTNRATFGDVAELQFNPCSTTFYHHRQSSSSLCYTAVAEPWLVAAGFIPAAARYSCRPTAGFFCSPDSPFFSAFAPSSTISKASYSRPSISTPITYPITTTDHPTGSSTTASSYTRLLCSCSAHAAPACSHPAVVQSFT